VLPTMAGSMEQVCARARVLLWRWLGKRCHMSYHYSATPHFRELFDCPTYTAMTYYYNLLHVSAFYGPSSRKKHDRFSSLFSLMQICRNSDSTALHSRNRTEETEVDVRMEKILRFIALLYVHLYNLNSPRH
jgi:hypothetical protein